MPKPSPYRSLPLLLVTAVFVAAGVYLRQRAVGPTAPGEMASAPECQGLTPLECQARLGLQESPPASATQEPVLSAAETCVNVGYLCADVQREGSLRVLRWPKETPLIRI